MGIIQVSSICNFRWEIKSSYKAGMKFQCNPIVTIGTHLQNTIQIIIPTEVNKVNRRRDHGSETALHS